MIEKKETRGILCPVQKTAGSDAAKRLSGSGGVRKNRRTEPRNFFSGTCPSICVKP